MDKREFLYRKKLVMGQIHALNTNLDKLEEKYIKENAKFKIGEKVKIITPPYKYYSVSTGEEKITNHNERFAFIAGFEIDYKGDVIPILKKAKKDGSISLINDRYIANKSYIERI